MAAPSTVDFHTEIHVAQFWRDHLGNDVYARFDADDLLRWYMAMEVRGADDLHHYLDERAGRHPMGAVTGIVAQAPHPPLDIVELWLKAHHKPNHFSYWGGLAGAGFCLYLVMTNLQSCINLSPVSYLASHPVVLGGPLHAASQQSAPAAAATLPASGTPPASAASPTASPSAASLAASHR